MRRAGHRRRALALALGLAAGCGADEPPPSLGPEAPDDPAVVLRACQADADTFVLRTLPWLHGRHPLGSAEVRLLGQIVDQLDARGRDGRRVLAQALAQGPDHRRRWRSELMDLLRTRRDGHRALINCYGEPGPAGQTPALAHFVRDHAPTEAFAGGEWSMSDLLESSLLADDLRPVLLADLVVRMTAPIDDANTAPDDLERARRTNFGRAFEAVYLGRRFECLSCHRDDASVTDDPDPSLDRFWPVATGLERAVYPADEDSLHAVFRYEGFAGGEVGPWGAVGCGRFAPATTDDPLGQTPFAGGSLPPGADAFALVERLRRGLDRLAHEGWTDAPTDGELALAELVVLHMVDGIWASVTGQRLTLEHGTPRNVHQAQRLRSLAVAFVRSGYSLRTLLAEIATDPQLDQAAPSVCEPEGPESLPALLDPFVDHNGPGHLAHRRDPFALVDEAHRVLGRRLPGLLMGQPGFDGEQMAALGAYLREATPGHDGVDLLGALAWEQALASMPDAPAAEPDHEPRVTLDDLLTLAQDDPTATVGDLAIAIKDRILADPEIDAQEQALVEALLELGFSEAASVQDPTTLRAAALRYARVLLAAPPFVLAGLEVGSEAAAPRLVPAVATPEALCAHWAPAVVPHEPWTCSSRGLTLP